MFTFSNNNKDNCIAFCSQFEKRNGSTRAEVVHDAIQVANIADLVSSFSFLILRFPVQTHFLNTLTKLGYVVLCIYEHRVTYQYRIFHYSPPLPPPP